MHQRVVLPVPSIGVPANLRVRRVLVWTDEEVSGTVLEPYPAVGMGWAGSFC
jgi:hypothetical protein